MVTVLRCGGWCEHHTKEKKGGRERNKELTHGVGEDEDASAAIHFAEGSPDQGTESEADAVWRRRRRRRERERGSVSLE